MRTYVETIKSYGRLFVAAIVIAALIGGWFAFRATKSYRSTAVVWVDNGPTVGSSLNPALATESEQDPPASVMQGELFQLLTSETFDRSVGSNSLLRGYSASQSHDSADDAYAIVQSISKGVTSDAVGPQVLSISYTGPTPEVSRSVLTSLLTRLRTQDQRLGAEYIDAEERYYTSQLSRRQTAVNSLEQSIAAYQKQHPEATAESDPIYAGLLSATSSRKAALHLRAAALEKVATQAARGASPLVDVLDRPTLPTASIQGFGKGVLGILAGAFAGLVVVLFAVLLLSPPSTGRWDHWDPPGIGRTKPARPGQHRSDWA